MGLFKKIFGDDEEREREEAAKRKAAEDYAEHHSHPNEPEHAQEPEHEHHTAAKPAAKKAAAAESEPAAKKSEPTAKSESAKSEPAAKKSTTKKAAAAKGEDAKGEDAKGEGAAKKAPAAKAAAAKKTADKPVAAAAAGQDPVPAKRKYAPLRGALAEHAHTHVHDVSEGQVTAEHDQMMTIHVETHVPEHAPREDDPHYHLFEQAKARLKRQGMWKCIIGDELCGGEPELHHTFIEFSQINEVDPKKIEQVLGLHFENDEEFQQWAESPGNLEVLCANHHRTHYGIHVIPGPLWEALRFRMVGTEAAAEFVTADEAKAEAKEKAEEKAKDEAKAEAKAAK